MGHGAAESLRVCPDHGGLTHTCGIAILPLLPLLLPEEREVGEAVRAGQAAVVSDTSCGERFGRCVNRPAISCAVGSTASEFSVTPVPACDSSAVTFCDILGFFPSWPVDESPQRASKDNETTPPSEQLDGAACREPDYSRDVCLADARGVRRRRAKALWRNNQREAKSGQRAWVGCAHSASREGKKHEREGGREQKAGEGTSNANADPPADIEMTTSLEGEPAGRILTSERSVVARGSPLVSCFPWRCLLDLTE